MKTPFKKKSAFDINYILKHTLFTKPLKIPKKKVLNASSIESAKKGDITFFNDIKYLDHLKKSEALFCFTRAKHLSFFDNIKTKPIISNQPLLDFVLTIKIFYPDSDHDFEDFKPGQKSKNFKSKNILIDKCSKIGKKFKIGENTVIKRNVIIGNNVSIGSNCVISNCVIGDNVIINHGSIIGKIGFGFKKIKEKIIFIPHIGRVIIDNDVYIGSNCTIDRGSFSDTIIGRNTMIDNLVHIAHNVQIGSDCFIAAQAGIAGSTKVGNNCLIGGQAGISGHLLIGNNVHIGGKSGVLKNIDSKNRIMGYPATSMKNFIKSMTND